MKPLLCEYESSIRQKKTFFNFLFIYFICFFPILHVFADNLRSADYYHRLFQCFKTHKLGNETQFRCKNYRQSFFYIKSWSPFIIVDNSVNLCLLNSTAEHTPSPTSQHFDYISPTLIPVSTILLWINPYSLMWLIFKSRFLLCL